MGIFPRRACAQMGRSMTGADVGHASRGGLVGKRFPRELAVSRLPRRTSLLRPAAFALQI